MPSYSLDADAHDISSHRMCGAAHYLDLQPLWSIAGEIPCNVLLSCRALLRLPEIHVMELLHSSQRVAQENWEPE
jgi:hypothetical protein